MLLASVPRLDTKWGSAPAERPLQAVSDGTLELVEDDHYVER
jgi:hypothetical protein